MVSKVRRLPLLLLLHTNVALVRQNHPRKNSALHVRAPERRPTDVAYGTCATSEARRHLLEPRVVVDDLYYLRDASDDETRRQLAAERARATARRARRARATPRVEALVPAAAAGDAWRAFGAWEWRGAADDEASGSGSGGARLESAPVARRAPRAALPSAFEGGAPYRGLVVGVSHVAIAPDGADLAYTVDATGGEVYSCEFALSDRPPLAAVDAQVAWAADGGLYALRCDGAGRPCELWLQDREGRERLLRSEPDERFRYEPPRPSSDGAAALLRVASRDGAEVLRLEGATCGVLAARVPGAPSPRPTSTRARVGVVADRGGDGALLRGDDAVAVAGARDLDAVLALGADAAVVGASRTAAAARRGVAAWGAGERRWVAPPGLGLQASSPSSASTSAACPSSSSRRRRASAPRRSACGVRARHPTALTGEAAALLDAGVAVAVAGVRGGGERGRAWHAAGRSEKRSAEGGGRRARAQGRYGAVVGRGRSAGGLSVGGAACLAPEAFDAVALDVPFLDALGTLQDGSLPLTINEWEEFGNPHEGAAHDIIASFSPLELAKSCDAAAFPRCLLRPALRDARTGWWEAFKFAAVLRDRGAGDIVVHADDRGHFGPRAGAACADVALPVAFLLRSLPAPGGARRATKKATPRGPAPLRAAPDGAGDARAFLVDASPSAAALAAAARLRTAAACADSAVYLHVAEGNDAAIALYRGRGFRDVAGAVAPDLSAALDAEVAGSDRVQRLMVLGSAAPDPPAVGDDQRLMVLDSAAPDPTAVGDDGARPKPATASATDAYLRSLSGTGVLRVAVDAWLAEDAGGGSTSGLASGAASSSAGVAAALSAAESDAGELRREIRETKERLRCLREAEAAHARAEAIARTLFDFIGECEAAGVDIAPLKDVAALVADGPAANKTAH
ncbi:serine-type exopeptidase [Aureococcus anophagefferens]|nr:serine-type exopeptidase [Aureococcus anophagefferens]